MISGTRLARVTNEGRVAANMISAMSDRRVKQRLSTLEDGALVPSMAEQSNSPHDDAILPPNSPNSIDIMGDDACNNRLAITLIIGPASSIWERRGSPHDGISM